MDQRVQRLNVRQSQIRECIEKSLFAIDQTPHFHKGEILLLQLVKNEAQALGKLRARIEFALVYEHYEVDHTGEISRQHWPQAGKTWKYWADWGRWADWGHPLKGTH
jgi:hypothetical protein